MMKHFKYLVHFTLGISLLCSNQLFAKSKLDSLSNLLSTEKNDSTKIYILVTLGKTIVVSNPDKAEEYANQALALAQEKKFKADRKSVV